MTLFIGCGAGILNIKVMIVVMKKVFRGFDIIN